MKQISILIILGLCLVCTTASALPVITTSISGNASGSMVRQYAINSVSGAGGSNSVFQSIALASSGTGTASQWANNMVFGAGSGTDVRQTISQSVTGNPGMVKMSALNGVDSLYGEARVSQSIQSSADGPHLIQEQANIARINSGTGNSVTQQLIATGNTGSTPESLLKQIQFNNVYWMNGATGSAVQDTVAFGTASILERIQQNNEFWINSK